MKKLFLILALWAMGSGLAQAQVATAAETSAIKQDNKPKRYLGMAEMGFLFGKGTSGSGSLQATPSVVLFNGYQFHQAFSLGFSVGIAAYEEMTIMPFALGMRGSFGQRQIKPFYAVDLGYGTTLLSGFEPRAEHRGGWLVNPSVGMQVGAGQHTAFRLGVGYSMQRARSEYSFWNGEGATVSKHSFQRLSLRMGFQF